MTIVGNLLGAPLGGLILDRAAGAAAPGLRDFHFAHLLSGTTGPTALLLAAACFGSGEALPTSSGAALFAALCKQRHFGTATGAFGTISDVGHASGPVLAGVLSARFSYGASFLVLAARIALALPVFLAGVPETSERRT